MGRIIEPKLDNRRYMWHTTINGGNIMDLRNVSLSHATNHGAHLAEAFLPLAEKNGFDKEAWEVPPEAWTDDNHDFWYTEESHFMIDEMFDILNSIAPEGYYFGAHPGDGSDFGFWEYED